MCNPFSSVLARGGDRDNKDQFGELIEVSETIRYDYFWEGAGRDKAYDLIGLL